MTRRGWSAVAALSAAAIVLAGCSTDPEQSASSPWVAPEIVESGMTSLRGGSEGAPAAIEQLVLDTTAGGELVNVAVVDGLPQGSDGAFGLFDPFGSVQRAAAEEVKPELGIENLSTGEVRNFGSEVYVGVSDQSDGSGSFGEFALLPDSTLVWMARKQTGELALDLYDVFSMAPGAQPKLIGSSTADFSGGLALSAPGDGNYLTVVGKNAWWVEGDFTDMTADAKVFSNIYSAPLDGSDPQRIAVEAARLPHADTCSTDPTLIYVTDATSSAGGVDRAALTSVGVGDDGDLAPATELWTAGEPGISVDSADACGNHYAVAYSDWSNGQDAETHPSGVVIAGPHGTDYFEMPEESTGAGRVTATPFGVFFFDWGVNYGAQYFYSYSTGLLYHVGYGASFGFTKIGDDCAAMAWMAPDEVNTTSSNYHIRKVCSE